MDKYPKIRNLGKGNMGVVQLVRCTDDNKVYVMKLIDLSKMSRKERTASLNEAKVLSSLRHPNVINYVDSFLDRKSEHLCIVMEHAEGGDLSAKIKHQRGQYFPEEQILDWFIQICLALHYCHTKRVLHRDIKTQNIFLTGGSVCKIGDFGISRVLQNTFDCAHTFVGTPYYLSPELVQERPYNTQSDVWALGVVLYELMALRHPFNATDMKGLMQRILRVQYDAPPNFYTPELCSIVGKILVKDPTKRIRVDQILQIPIIKNRLQTWQQHKDLPTIPQGYLSNLRQAGVLSKALSKGGSSDDDTDSDSESLSDEDIAQPAPRRRSGGSSAPRDAFRLGGGKPGMLEGDRYQRAPPGRGAGGGGEYSSKIRSEAKRPSPVPLPSSDVYRNNGMGGGGGLPPMEDQDLQRRLEQERERQLHQLHSDNQKRLKNNNNKIGNLHQKPSVLEPLPHRLQPVNGKQQQVVRDRREVHESRLPPLPSHPDSGGIGELKAPQRRNNYHQAPPPPAPGGLGMPPKNLLAGGLGAPNRLHDVDKGPPSSTSRQSYLSNPSTRYSAYNAYYEARRQAEMYRLRNANPPLSKPAQGLSGLGQGGRAWR